MKPPPKLPLRPAKTSLDRIDLSILEALRQNGRITYQALSERVGLSPRPCLERVRRLEKRGVIRGYTALVDRERVGLQLCVLAEVNLTRHAEDDVRKFEQAVAAEPRIVSCYATTGQADYVIKVLVPDIKRYESFLHDTMFKLPGVTHVRSSVVLKEVKSESRLPLDVPGTRAAGARRARA